jgi:chaperonin GroEL (HSP60 family)
MLRFDLSTPEKFRQLREERLKFIRQRGEQIARSGANAVFCRKGMDEELIDYLGRRGVLAVRAVVDEDLARVSLATGAKVVTDVEQLSEETLGYAKLIEERKIGKTEWIFIDGCLAARNVSVLVLGPNDAIATDIEYTLRNAIAYTASLMQNPLVLFGGGAIEIELASRLRSWAPSISGKKQLAVLAFAEALEETPVFLARNAGMKSLDFLVKLRAQHAAGQISAGIDSVALRITDMRKLKVYDPLELVHQMLTSAAEAAAAILRTDYIMKVPRTQEEIIEKKKKERERRGKKPEDWVDEIPY